MLSCLSTAYISASGKRKQRLNVSGDNHQAAFHAEEQWSLGVCRPPESRRGHVSFMCLFFFSNCFLNLSVLLFDKGFYHAVNTTLWEKLLLFLWADVSAPGQGGERASATSLLLLPSTLRLWKNYCEAIHLGSAWDLLWRIYWLLNLYSSRTSKPIYGFTHLHSRERECGEKGEQSPPLSDPLANFLGNGIHHFFPVWVPFFNQNFSQSIGMWKFIGERKSSKIIQSTTTR